MITDQEAQPLQPEKVEQSPDQRLVKSAISFTEYLTKLYPQVTLASDNLGRPQLNYYIAGSSAIALLAEAKSFTVIDGTMIPSIQETTTTLLPIEALQYLMDAVRQVGDFDVIQIEERDYTFGNTGPVFSFDKIPEDARGIFDEHRFKRADQIVLDPVTGYGSYKIAKIDLGRSELYIARPDTILGYKVLKILEHNNITPCNEYFVESLKRFNSDFTRILKALRTLYTNDQLLETAYQIISDYEVIKRASINKSHGSIVYESDISKDVSEVLTNPHFSTEIKGFFSHLNRLDRG